MEPFSPHDPLSKLLGKARPVEPRPNFTQNVLRAVRQLPRRMTLRERFTEWCASLSRPALAGACAVAAAGLLAFMTLQNDKADIPPPGRNTLTMAMTEDASSADAELATTFNDLNQLSTLLAQNDARTMTDTEVALLVY